VYVAFLAPVQGSGIERLRLIMIPSQLDLPRRNTHLSAQTRKEQTHTKKGTDRTASPD
jgi:hypothetical protein